MTSTKKMRQRLKDTRSAGTFFVPKAGKNLIRVLPGIEGKCYVEDGELFFWGEMKEHIVRTDTFNRFRCLSPKWCPACATVKLFDKSDDKELKEKARHIFGRTRFNINVVTESRGDVKVWSPSNARIEEMLDIIDDDEWGDFTDPEEGFCLNLRRTGEGRDTKYKISASTKTVELPTDWKDQAHDLMVVGPDVLTAKEIRNMMVDKYEIVYEGLGSELIRMFRARQKRKSRR